MRLGEWISKSARQITLGLGAVAAGSAMCGACDDSTPLQPSPLPPGSSSSSSSGIVSTSSGGPCGVREETFSLARPATGEACATDASVGPGTTSDAGVCAEPDASCTEVCARAGMNGVASCDFGADESDAGEAGLDASLDASDAGSSDGGPSPEIVRCRITLYCGGRSYDGAPEDGRFVRVMDRGTTETLGETFADIAALEWTSVTAFERLARALAHHGAPPDLVARAKSFADDERRHTELVSGLARAHGGAPRLRAPSGDETLPSLRSLAEENAAEGCVRETLGALVARVQAMRSTAPSIRAVFDVVADEEARHAELSWELHAWFLEALAGEDRAAVEDALAGAMRSLEDTLPPRLSSSDARVFGFGLAEHAACVRRLRSLRAAHHVAA